MLSNQANLGISDNHGTPKYLFISWVFSLAVFAPQIEKLKYHNEQPAEGRGVKIMLNHLYNDQQ